MDIAAKSDWGVCLLSMIAVLVAGAAAVRSIERVENPRPTGTYEQVVEETWEVLQPYYKHVLDHPIANERPATLEEIFLPMTGIWSD